MSSGSRINQLLKVSEWKVSKMKGRACVLGGRWCGCGVGGVLGMGGVAQGIKDLSALPCLRSSGGGVKQASVKF